IGEFYLEGPATGRPAAQCGNAALYACPHGVYPSAGEDRWVAIAVVGDGAWERFAGALGWPLEPALASLDGRLAARAALDRRVAEWTRARSAGEAAAALQAAGVSAMPVENGDDHRADPHLAARGAIVTVEHPEIGPERHSGNPLRLSLTPLDIDGTVRYDMETTDEENLLAALGNPALGWFASSAWGGGGAASVLVLAATAIAAGMASTVLVYRSRARGKQSAYGPGAHQGGRYWERLGSAPLTGLNKWHVPHGLV